MPMTYRKIYHYWSEEDLQYLVDHVETQTYQELAAHFGRSRQLIAQKVDWLRNRGVNVPQKRRGKPNPSDLSNLVIPDHWKKETE